MTQEEIENLKKPRRTKGIESAVRNLPPQDKLEANQQVESWTAGPAETAGGSHQTFKTRVRTNHSGRQKRLVSLPAHVTKTGKPRSRPNETSTTISRTQMSDSLKMSENPILQSLTQQHCQVRLIQVTQSILLENPLI